LFDYLLDRVGCDQAKKEDSLTGHYFVSELEPTTHYSLLCNGSSVYYCCWMSFFIQKTVEQHPNFICSCSHLPTTSHDAKEIDILVPACLFMLSKTASPIHLCSLLSSMMRVLAQNENKVTEQLLQFLVCDCLRPIPGVLGVQFQIGDESTTLSVPYNNNQLQNSNSLDHYYHLSILFENPF